MHNHDHTTDTWLEKLDEIVAGENDLSANDDELLQLATQLVTSFKPLRHMRRAIEAGHQHVPSHFATKYAHRRTHSPFRICLLVAVALLLVLVVATIGSGAGAPIKRSMTQAWHTSTSLDQIDGISIDSLSRPHAGLKPLPLLPALLPGGTQAMNYGVITDVSHPNILKTFVADYRIYGKDVLLYEQPTYGLFLSSIAKEVRIGARSGQVFQDDAGNTALQWYQQGMMCQVTSKLPVDRLIALAGVFQPLQSWDLLL